MSGTGGPHLALMAVALSGYSGVAVLAALLHRRTLTFVYPACLVIAIIACAVDLSALLGAANESARLPLGLPTVGLNIHLDALAAYFGFVVNLGVLAASLYGLGLDARTELSGRVEPFFAVFALAMNLVLIADDAFAFLFSWEFMSLTSWVLVVARHEDADNRKAGHVYLVMAAIGTVALLFAFGGLAGPAGGYAFEAIRAHRPDAIVSGLVLTAAIVGAGSKAGIMPLHAWLPLAHPAAPSHVSALMSGVMTKVAIYGLLRIVFDLLGPPVWWWSLPFILLGALSAVGALLYAIVDQDLKRVLAYSTIENIGIIFVGLGLAIAFKATGLYAAAGIAMAAALLHTLNHSIFKSLLFLGAGVVLHATGRRDFDGLGGLIQGMPRTAFCWLIGALSISALPPFNGFVSEWLLFQSVLAGPAFPEPLLRFLSPMVGAMLALAAGLAAACFVRAFGIVFLGRPRSPDVMKAHEAPPAQLAALGLLTGLCILGGLFGSVIAGALSPLLIVLAGSALPGVGAGPTPFSLVAFSAARSTYDAPIVALFVILSATATTLFVHWVSERRVRRGPAWDCGYPEPSPATQYTASSFGQPLRRVYGTIIFGARERVDMPAPGDMRPARLTVNMTDYLWRGLYVAPASAVLELSVQLNVFQFLTIRRYLVLMFVALILLLLVTASWI